MKAFHTYGYGICVEKIKNVEKDRLLSLIRMAPEFYGEYQEWEKDWILGQGYEPDVEDILVDFVEDCAQFSHENLASILQDRTQVLRRIHETSQLCQTIQKQNRYRYHKGRRRLIFCLFSIL